MKRNDLAGRAPRQQLAGRGSFPAMHYTAVAGRHGFRQFFNLLDPTTHMKQKQRLITCSLRQAATELGVDRSVLARLVAQRRIAPAGRGPNGYATYPLRDLIAATQDRSHLSEFERAADAKAELSKLRLTTQRATLVDRDDARRVYADTLATVERLLRGLPERLARDVEGITPAMLDRVSRHVDAALDELRRTAEAGE